MTIETTYETTMQMHLTPIDETMPFRFVGSYEYGNCLRRFTRLAEISTDEEIKTYDEVLNEHPEFTYYQGVSTAFQSPPDLRKANPDERSKFDDKFQKGGLAWMLALARVEYGATLSLYSNSKTPFVEVVGDSKYGLDEYFEILVDDSASHIKAMATEKIFIEIMNGKRSLDSWTLAYIRRLKVIKDMMLTISKRADSQQLESMKPYYRDIVKFQKSLTYLVKLATEKYSAGTFKVRQFVEGRDESHRTAITNVDRTYEAITAHCQALLDEMKKQESEEPSQNGGSRQP